MYGKIVGASLVAVALVACALWSSSPVVAVSDAEGSAVVGGGCPGTGTQNGYQACGFANGNPANPCSNFSIFVQASGTGWSILSSQATCYAGAYAQCSTAWVPNTEIPATCN